MALYHRNDWHSITEMGGTMISVICTSGQWPLNQNGFLENAFYRWDGMSSNFFLKNTDGDWIRQTWHHHQDGQTLLPVPTEIHNFIGTAAQGFEHSGGAKIIKLDPPLIGVFSSPEY